MSFDLTGLQELVKGVDFAEGICGEEPDFSRAWVIHPHQDDVGLAVIDGERAHLLTIGR